MALRETLMAIMFSKVRARNHPIPKQVPNHFNQLIFHDDSLTPRIILSLIMFKRLLLK